jgi:hypothetical protein
VGGGVEPARPGQAEQLRGDRRLVPARLRVGKCEHALALDLVAAGDVQRVPRSTRGRCRCGRRATPARDGTGRGPQPPTCRRPAPSRRRSCRRSRAARRPRAGPGAVAAAGPASSPAPRRRRCGRGRRSIGAMPSSGPDRGRRARRRAPSMTRRRAIVNTHAVNCWSPPSNPPRVRATASQDLGGEIVGVVAGNDGQPSHERRVQPAPERAERRLVAALRRREQRVEGREPVARHPAHVIARRNPPIRRNARVTAGVDGGGWGRTGRRS